MYLQLLKGHFYEKDFEIISLNQRLGPNAKPFLIFIKSLLKPDFITRGFPMKNSFTYVAPNSQLCGGKFVSVAKFYSLAYSFYIYSYYCLRFCEFYSPRVKILFTVAKHARNI
jgi:hypothetical protein